MILNALVEKLKRRSKDDFKGRHYEVTLIMQAVSWYLRYPLSNRDIEELFLERGLEVDHSTLNRWVLAYASPWQTGSCARRSGSASIRRRPGYGHTTGLCRVAPATAALSAADQA